MKVFNFFIDDALLDKLLKKQNGCVQQQIYNKVDFDDVGIDFPCIYGHIDGKSIFATVKSKSIQPRVPWASEDNPSEYFIEFELCARLKVETFVPECLIDIFDLDYN